MGLHPNPSQPEPLRPGDGTKVTDLGSAHRLVDDGAEQLAHGALLCPRCAVPVSIDAGVGVGEEMRCGYCAHRGPAREYFVRDVFDTTANEVSLVARIA